MRAAELWLDHSGFIAGLGECLVKSDRVLRLRELSEEGRARCEKYLESRVPADETDRTATIAAVQAALESAADEVRVTEIIRD